jgi:hypothetical protein
MSLHPDQTELSWRIPVEADPQVVRVRMLRVALAALVCGGVLLLLAPPEMRTPGLLTIMLLATGLWIYHWRSSLPPRDAEDNARLDDAGFHWIDGGGGRHQFDRREIAGFHIAVEADTLRDVPALTLHLAGGFESQPIELHAPATAPRVREFLIERLGISERTSGSQPHEDHDAGVVDAPINNLDVESCEQQRTWHFTGPKSSLLALCDHIEQASRTLKLAPAGAKPQVRRIGTEEAHLTVQLGRNAWTDGQTLCGPAEHLLDIAAHIRKQLSTAGENADVEVPTSPDAKQAWTLHFHVAE